MAEVVLTYTDFAWWTCPAGVTSVLVELWGGGGGGARVNGSNSVGAGGAGGCYSRKTVTVTPGQQYSIYIGPAGSNSYQGKFDGGSTQFYINGGELFCLASGGKTANTIENDNLWYVTEDVLGSTVGCIGDTFYKGGNGGKSTTFYESGGGGGAAGSTGNGGNASGRFGGYGTSEYGGDGSWGHLEFATSGLQGQQYGGGGSGASTYGTTGPAYGGQGATGFARLTYDQPPAQGRILFKTI